MKVINSYSSDIKKEKGIVLTRYGLKYFGPDKIYDGKIHQIDLGYRIDKAMKFDEARAYFYEVVDGLLNCINQNEKLKEYFYHYPLGYEDLDFSLSFDYENKGTLKCDDIRAIHIQFNEILYEIIEEEGPSRPILESRGCGLAVMNGYTNEPRCIVRKLPESSDTLEEHELKPKKPDPETVKKAEMNILETLSIVASERNANVTTINECAKSMAEIMARIGYFDEKFLLGLPKANYNSVLAYLFHHNKTILPENLIDYLFSNKIIKNESNCEADAIHK